MNITKKFKGELYMKSILKGPIFGPSGDPGVPGMYSVYIELKFRKYLEKIHRYGTHNNNKKKLCA